MSLNPEAIRTRLKQFDFSGLFIEELGWQAPRRLKLAAPSGTTIREIAHLGGIPALEVCTGDRIPEREARNTIHAALARQTHENLLIFVDKARTQTVWYWVKREGGKSAVREHLYVKGQTGDLFLAKLAGLFVDIEEYDTTGQFSILAAGRKLREALDVSRVTRRFYDAFKERHIEFLELISGIDSEFDRRWYASVLLNRLMFVYFLQKKGFLDDGNFDYLGSKQCAGYFQNLLKPLFFEGFALLEAQRSAATRKKLGSIPYLNGGLFLPHSIEIKYPNIDVPDRAFTNVLALFDSYSWNLNDVPGARDDELNPDVLGYIFEKYINDQKSAGAYYTAPEITEYLCERTIHDLLVERVSVLRGGKMRKFTSVGDMLLNLDGDLCRTIAGTLDELRLCDPAVGSGAFLVAALKTLTDIHGALWGRAEVLHDEELKLILTGDRQRHKSPFYAIRKRIITRNLYGVDLMPEATEIARLRLFLALVASAATVDELEPLPNIEFNILPGNSLIGMRSVEAKDFISGGLFVKTQFNDLEHRKRALVQRYRDSQAPGKNELTRLKDEANELRSELADLCNEALLEEFKVHKISYETTDATGKKVKAPLRAEQVRDLQPFHWGSEFAEVMEAGGFDAIITNPPWEIWKPNAKEFFQQYSDLITKKKMTMEQFESHQKELLKDPHIVPAWLQYQSQFPHAEAYFRTAPAYSNQVSIVNGRKAVSDVNLYKLFLERCYRLTREGGRCGIVIPSGLYTDLGAKQLREMLFSQSKISALFGFENRKEIFEGVHRSFKFVVLSFRKGGVTETFPAAFMRHDVTDLEGFPAQGSVEISVGLVRQLSPDSLSVMEFKGERDVEIAKKMLRAPLLSQRNIGQWNLSLGREFHMMDDRLLFKTDPTDKVPMIEGKNIWHFIMDFDVPRYWICERDGRAALAGKHVDAGGVMPYQRHRFAMRRIASNTNERTLISTVLRPGVFTSESLHIDVGGLGLTESLFLTSIFNSFVLDYFARQKITANINQFIVYSLPVPRCTQQDKGFNAIAHRAARLICTEPGFDELAQAAGLGSYREGAIDGAERRRLRAELDGIVAHLYGLTESEFTHILGTFPLVPEPDKLAARNAYRDIERGVLEVWK